MNVDLQESLGCCGQVVPQLYIYFCILDVLLLVHTLSFMSLDVTMVIRSASFLHVCNEAVKNVHCCLFEIVFAEFYELFR